MKRIKNILSKKKKKVYSFIRISTEEQKTGDGLRRQLQLAEDFVSRNGYHLDEETKLEHHGSAFKSKHLKEGEFAKFLHLLEIGEIEKGSILVVENLDRMSRDHPKVALRLWLSILEQGVEIVTLEPDEKRFIHDTIETIDIMFALGQFDTANLESRKKSKRNADAWVDKRANPNLKESGTFAREIRKGIEVSGVPTRKCPAWIVFDESEEKFKIKSEAHKKTIKLIFDLAERKKGKGYIAQHLNENEVESFSGTSWHRSYIYSILTNKAVIGEKQFTKGVKSATRKTLKREATRDPIKNYYPKIISFDQFETVQEIIDSRKVGHFEPKSVSWLAGLTTCFYSETKMYKKWQGDNEYLTSRAAQDKIKGHVDGVLRLDETEMWILKNLHDFDFSSVLESKRNRELEEAEDNLGEVKASIRARMGGKTRMMERWEALSNNDSDDFLLEAVENKITNTGKEIENLERQQLKLESQISEIRKSSAAAEDIFGSIRKWKPKLSRNDNRALFSNQLKKQVDHIELAIWGTRWDKKHYDKKFRELSLGMGVKEITTDAFDNLNKKTFETDPLFLLYWYQNLANALIVKNNKETIPYDKIGESLSGENFFLREPTNNRKNIFLKIKFKNTDHCVWTQPKWIEQRGGRGLLLANNSRINYTLYIDNLRKITFGDPHFSKSIRKSSVDVTEIEKFSYRPNKKHDFLMETFAEEIWG
jgi:DNA invertase Pin-like site-specific DNA recombinase